MYLPVLAHMAEGKAVGSHYFWVICILILASAVSAAPGDTQLFVEIDAGEQGQANYRVIVRITNIGDYAAQSTVVTLHDIPDDWQVSPDITRTIPRIDPGEAKEVDFLIHKGPTDATIYATAKAKNSDEATSESIAIPVFWITIILMMIAMIVVAKNARNPR